MEKSCAYNSILSRNLPAAKYLQDAIRNGSRWECPPRRPASHIPSADEMLSHIASTNLNDFLSHRVFLLQQTIHTYNILYLWRWGKNLGLISGCFALTTERRKMSGGDAQQRQERVAACVSLSMQPTSTSSPSASNGLHKQCDLCWMWLVERASCLRLHFLSPARDWKVYWWKHRDDVEMGPA
jgi:hypothetical protein